MVWIEDQTGHRMCRPTADSWCCTAETNSTCKAIILQLKMN